MSDKDKKSTVDQEKPKPDTEAKASVNKGALAMLIVILLSLLWYLTADRFTPYTSQARVQGYVVGVAPEVSGLITDVWVKNNQPVTAGQKLFQIDSSDYRIALDQAQANLLTAHRQVDAGNAAVEAARANLRAAQANEQKAEKDATRLERLYREDPGTISMRMLEISQATLDQSRAATAAAKADIQRAIEQKGGEDEENNAILMSASSAVDKAELDLASTTVTASLDGIITDLRADVGKYAGAGSPILTLISIHDFWINAEFTENNLGHLDAGSRVEILFDVLPGRIYKGQVRSIGMGVSTGQLPPPGTLPTIQNNRDWLRQSQRFPAVIEFDVAQSEDLWRKLRVGGQATVISYTEGHWFLNLLGKFYIRLMSVFSYAY